MSEVRRERLGLLVIRVRLERGGGRLIARITGTPDVDDLPPVTTVAGSPAAIERAVREWLETLLTPDQDEAPTDPRGP
jgi:hypothetical protein